MPPLPQIWRKGFEQDAVTSNCWNSIQELAGSKMSEYSPVAVISMSWLTIMSTFGLTFLIMW